MQSMPLEEISIRELNRASMIEKLVKASEEVGFIRLTDFPEQPDFQGIMQASRLFFEQSEEDKWNIATHTYRSKNTNQYRGYFPSIEGSHSLKEGFEFGWSSFTPTKPGHPLQEPSIFPEKLINKKWMLICDRYFNDMLAIGNSILAAYESSLKLAPGSITQLFKNSMSTLRFIHYPEAKENLQEGLETDKGIRFSTPNHTDSGILTLLLQDETGGLQAKAPDGTWLDIPSIPDTLVMNLGALLETLSGNRLKATEHRVIAPKTSRYSIPFFYEPSPDAVLTPFFSTSDQAQSQTYEQYLVDHMKEFVEYEGLIKQIESL